MKFSNSGMSLAIGFSDGIIEIWNPNTGKIRSDLQY